MARLVLGPLLRYLAETEATVWVETDAPCEVQVLGCRARTFPVLGHHYALVHCSGLEPGTVTEYEVALDGERAWPEAGSDMPPSVIRTPEPGGPVKLLFGSCRVAAPHHAPYALPKDEHPEGREADALRGVALQMRDTPPEEWPHLLLMLGDQVYADEVSPATKEALRARRDTTIPPYETVADFEEYTLLYRESWGEPYARWLLSTVSTAMIFDDHDVHDDWNTSEAWIRGMRAEGWWDERIVGGLASYWLYQHLGNLAPADLGDDPLYCALREADDGDAAGALLREFAFRADREVEGKRWSFCRDIGPARLIMMDSRAGRMLGPGRREMIDDEEFRWIEEHLEGDYEHLLLGTSLPLLLAPGMHYLEAWNEAVCDGAWGALGMRAGEKIRQGLDLEHWAAFGDSFRRVCGLIGDVATGRRGPGPASVVALSGDVHHAYLAEVGFPAGTGASANVWQATCSPFRNPLDDKERTAIRFATSRPAQVLTRALARSAGVEDPPVRWRFVHEEPWFDNQVATLDLHGRRARMGLHKTVAGDEEALDLEQVFEATLS
ncbi:MAG TPA: alkaline phosphatase D family protein [Solirubrobacteraceae bacterium]|jgi:hypothetical protein